MDKKATEILYRISVAFLSIEICTKLDIIRALFACARLFLFGSEETNRQMSGEYDQNQPEKKKPLPKLFQPL